MIPPYVIISDLHSRKTVQKLTTDFFLQEKELLEVLETFVIIITTFLKDT